jgi:hypothetical protein
MATPTVERGQGRERERERERGGERADATREQMSQRLRWDIFSIFLLRPLLRYCYRSRVQPAEIDRSIFRM